MAATDRLTPEPRRFAIRLPRPVMAILFLSFTIPAGVVTAQDAGKKSDSIQSRPAIVVPKDLSEWRLSLNLGVVGPDRDETGWYEIAVDSDRRRSLRRYCLRW